MSHDVPLAASAASVGARPSEPPSVTLLADPPSPVPPQDPDDPELGPQESGGVTAPSSSDPPLPLGPAFVILPQPVMIIRPTMRRPMNCPVILRLPYVGVVVRRA